MNTFARRALAATLSAAMISGSLPAIALAEAPEQTLETAASQSVNATVRFMSLASPTSDSSVTVPYSDEFFAQPAQTYSSDLMVASLGCAAAAGSSAEAASQSELSKNIKAFFASCGFAGYAENADWSSPTTHDTSAVSVAYRDAKVNGKPTRIYGIAFRGQGYDHEWYSNLTVGSSGYHQGFNAATQRALAFAESYIAANPAPAGSQSLFWLSGYSRGGAIANLAAAQILHNGKIGKQSVSPEQVYAYTFEAPSVCETAQAEKDKALYASIHNIVNPSDWISMLLHAQFDLTLLGEMRDPSGNAYVPDGSSWEANAYSSAKLQPFYAKLKEIVPSATYGAENFQELIMLPSSPAYPVVDGESQAAYLYTFAPFLFGLFGVTDRASYVSNAQTDLANLFEWTMGAGRNDFNKLVAAIKENAIKEAQDPGKYIDWPFSVASAEGEDTLQVQGSIDEATPAEGENAQLIEQYLEAQAQQEDTPYPIPTLVVNALRLISALSDESKVSLFIHDVFAASFQSVGISYNDAELVHVCDSLAHGICEKIDDDDDFSELATFIQNASSISTPHAQEAALAWALTLNGKPAPAKTGWYRDASGRWRYAVLNPDGSVTDKKGWLSWEGAWYYLGSDGVMYKNRWVSWSGKWYYFGGDGAMLANRWLSWAGDWYYLGSDGAMFENRWVKYGADWYYLGGDGKMARNAWIGQYYVDGSGKWVNK